MQPAIRVPDIYKREFERAAERGYLATMQQMAPQISETVSNLLGTGSRETNLQNIKGDYRNGVAHGFGVMQVDKGTDPHYAATWSEANYEAGIIRGCEIYAEKRQQIFDGQGKPLRVWSTRARRWFNFTGRAVEADDLRRITTAAYNAGLWAFYAWSNNKHIDSFTWGQDYGRDVYSRAIYFSVLLDSAGIEAGAFEREVAAQGDYCLERIQRLAGVTPTPDDKETLERFKWSLQWPPDRAPEQPTAEEMAANPAAPQTMHQQTSPPSGSTQAAPGGVPVQAAGGPWGLNDAWAKVQAVGGQVGQITGQPVQKVFLQSLKMGREAIGTIIAVVLGAITWARENPGQLGIALLIIGLVVVIIHLARMLVKFKLDHAVIQTAADPGKVTVQPDKRANKP